MSSFAKTLELDPRLKLSPLQTSAEYHTHTHARASSHRPLDSLPSPIHTHHHISAPVPKDLQANDETSSKSGVGSIYFVGTATVILEWAGLRIMTDPNFLHAGDHVHLGPGVTAKRLTNPAVNLEDLPPIDAVVLSHFHEDHFDTLVQSALRKDLPIISTPHAVESLKALGFTNLTALDTWDELMIVPTHVSSSSSSSQPSIRLVSTPGEHVSGPVVSTLNDIIGAVPPTSGWILELHRGNNQNGRGYKIYISGDTLMVDKLKEIPKRFPKVDLLLVHLGGTTVPSAQLPLLMVTMNAEQGVQLIKLIKPLLTLPIHYDDYDVFLSPLQDFKSEIQKAAEEESEIEAEKAGSGGEGVSWLKREVIFWERGDKFEFGVQ
ncbi:Predicted Zn-dependent hydrolase (beta-lactamase superfamily) [Phaffia rhodozyma]|uniref:Predicted Zn-dependent hydrolase (Beta-lactamase superfamily) n=1 Tax=Phaffia rhodozyma TaxID=264483 RepID=A0A0F7SJP2_PHARH|nr:Predicted Zn-dependent hydrolase (beta-lactamase superfamily) [Phaffia rhodozyma]